MTGRRSFLGAIGGLLCGLAVLPVQAQDVCVGYEPGNDCPFVLVAFDRALMPSYPQETPVERIAKNTAATVALAEPAPSLNDGPFSVRAEVGAVSTLTDAETSVKPTAWIEATMPFGLFVATARLGLTARPGEDIDLTAVETFSDAELGLGLTRYFRSHGDSRIGATVEAGFSTARDESGVEPLSRLSRYAGVGLAFDHADGANLTILWGRDEATGEDFGIGSLLLYGRLPIVGTKGILVLNGDVAVALGSRTSSEGLPQSFRDVWKIGVVADLTAALASLK